MSLFSNPEIKKRWEAVLKRQPQTHIQKAIIFNQGDTFQHHYLIVEGSIELYRELSFKKLGVTAHITTLGPFDVICLNLNEKAQYTARVKSYQLKYIALRDHEKEIVMTKAVNEWRKARAEIAQRKYDNAKANKKHQQKQRAPLLKFMNNGSISSQCLQRKNKSLIKLPALSALCKTRITQLTSRSTSIVKDRKTPMCQDSQKLFSSVLKQYLSKRIDYESSNIPLTICTGLEAKRRESKQKCSNKENM